MELHTPICDLLCCDVPVVLAGMGGVARAELVAAVTEAGGFGFLGMVREPADFVAAQIAEVRARTGRAFGVNLIPAATPPELLRAQVEVCIATKVHAVTLFWDTPSDLVDRFRDAGILVARQVGSLAEAIDAQAAKADIVIAQGWEAGGHVRGRTARASLVADIVARLDIPVLAAGGIVDGSDMAAAMLLGAQGVMLGSAFLATEESFAHDYHKRRIVEAQADTTVHTDAFHVNWPLGAHVRVLPNSVTRGARGDPFFHQPDVIGAEGERPVRLFSTDSPLRSMTGDFEAMALYAGQGVGRVSSVIPAAQRLAEIADEAARLLGLDGDRAAADQDPVQLASPVCYAMDAPDSYMGFASRDEIVAELNLLLEAKRASARVAVRWAAESPDADLRAAARAIYAEELEARRVLFEALLRLSASPSQRVGGFYDNAMAVKGAAARLRFLRREQDWVRTRLRVLIPRIRDDALHGALTRLAQEQGGATAPKRRLACGERDEPAPSAGSKPASTWSQTDGAPS